MEDRISTHQHPLIETDTYEWSQPTSQPRRVVTVSWPVDSDIAPDMIEDAAISAVRNATRLTQTDIVVDTGVKTASVHRSSIDEDRSLSDIGARVEQDLLQKFDQVEGAALNSAIDSAKSRPNQNSTSRSNNQSSTPSLILNKGLGHFLLTITKLDSHPEAPRMLSQIPRFTTLIFFGCLVSASGTHDGDLVLVDKQHPDGIPPESHPVFNRSLTDRKRP